MRLLPPKFIFLFVFLLLTQTANADPWFTGPIFAPAGHNVPRGHTNLEVYGLDVFTNGQFDNHWRARRIPQFKSVVLNPLLTHGFTDWLDVQLSVPYSFNNTRGVSYNRLTDIGIGAGIQLFEQRKSEWMPDVRFFIQETFPTGKFDQLNPAFLGTDATGLGSYRTLLSLNFQYLKHFYGEHYLRTRLMLSTLFSSTVHVEGLNSFGGSVNTAGDIRPGSEENIDLAFEYTLTQNWVAVLEGYYSEGQSTRFNGIIDIINDGSVRVGYDRYDEIALAPALEYNFTSNVGVIGGIWFPVAGRNTSQFITYVLAVNAFW
ncbi:MAG: hypothetical protein BGO90_00605 [Legionella sp. 40-6]|nr:hypothetical protein [Legionella sp.]OJY46425.1 MAG: hypothetical protein BGO90_00605 [Legionella sp. 40-6]